MFFNIPAFGPPSLHQYGSFVGEDFIKMKTRWQLPEHLLGDKNLEAASW